MNQPFEPESPSEKAYEVNTCSQNGPERVNVLQKGREVFERDLGKKNDDDDDRDENGK